MLYLLAVSALFFIFNAFLRPAVNTLISKAAGSQQGYASGLSTTYTSLGNIIGPIMAGTLFDVNINFPYLVGAVILFASLSLTFRFQSAKKGAIAEHD
ncbi:Major Facilitator Superfamily protein [compost metagenome]